MLTLLQLAMIGVLGGMLALSLRWSVCDADSFPVGCDWSARRNACTSTSPAFLPKPERRDAATLPQ